MCIGGCISVLVVVFVCLMKLKESFGWTCVVFFDILVWVWRYRNVGWSDSLLVVGVVCLWLGFCIGGDGSVLMLIVVCWLWR